MNTPLQERENLQRSLENLNGPLVRSQDRCRTYSDLLHQLKMLSSQEGEGKLRMQVDVGASVMMQAEAASVSMLLIDVGLGFSVVCDLAKAQEIASLHVSTAQADMAMSAEQGRRLQAGLLRECKGTWTADPGMHA